MVEVRPLDEQKWHGKTGKDAFAQPKTIEVLYNSETGRYNTGLTEQEAETYGKLLGVDLSDRFDAEEGHSYWGNKASWIQLPNHTMFFDPKKAQEFVKIKNMKASKRVANSLAEYEKGDFPEATHYIYDEDEQADVQASKIASKRKANAAIDGLSVDGKKALLLILSKKSMKNRSNNAIDVELDAEIEKDPVEFMRLFNMGKDEVRVRAQVLEMINLGILNKDATGISFMGDILAYDYEEMVRWMKETDNQRLKVVLLEKLNTN